jgi:sulfotransferase family protein
LSPEKSSASPSDLAGRLVWMFGSPRTGSTWLMQLFAELPGIAVIDESYVPLHLVPIDHTAPGAEYFEQGQRANDPHYFFAKRYMPELRTELREVILRGLLRQLGELGQTTDPEWLVIKEPNGSHAADTVMSLFPESRLLFLVRDGRDVIDSLIDAMLARDSWWQQSQVSDEPRIVSERMAFIRHHAQLWRQRTESVQRAYEALPDEQRIQVGYESLLADTEPGFQRMLDWLRFDADPEAVREAVEKRAFSSIPADQKGPGKRARSATPGQWRERLRPQEIEVVEEIMGPKLAELGYEAGVGLAGSPA